MGEDIHLKTYVYSKIENKYIDALSLSSNVKYSCFRPWFDGRNYDFFSMLGSTRSDMRELSRYHDGMPEFVNETFQTYARKHYYGFRWFYASDLVKSIDEYIGMLKDPTKYFEYDDDAMNSDYYQEWADEHQYLISLLDSILKFIKMTEEECEDTLLNDCIDPSKTVYLVYFDS